MAPLALPPHKMIAQAARRVLWLNSVAEFHCLTCGAAFSVSEQALSKYPGWKPKLCLKCRNKDTAMRPAAKRPVRRSPKVQPSREADLTLEEVLATFRDGPVDGVFTDGAADPNPGPGGWGAVHVRGNHVLAQEHGHEPLTTNNRMELTALLRGCALVPRGERATVYTDSQLCVQTINEWAPGWEARGWRRKSGPIKNLELVQELYREFQSRPELTLTWIAAHSGNRWNEYADALATAYRRMKV